MAVAHFTLDFRAGHQRGNRVHHQHVNRVRAHQRIDDFQRLFTGIGLRDDQFVNVDAQLLGIDRIERVFGIDEGCRAAALLRFGDDMQRQRGLARAFRAVDFDHATTRQTAHAQRDVQPERAGGNGFNLHRLFRAELHRAAFAKGAVNLGKRCFQRLLTVHRVLVLAFLDQLELSSHGNFLLPRRPTRKVNMAILYRVCSDGTSAERNLFAASGMADFRECCRVISETDATPWRNGLWKTAEWAVM